MPFDEYKYQVKSHELCSFRSIDWEQINTYHNNWFSCFSIFWGCAEYKLSSIQRLTFVFLSFSFIIYLFIISVDRHSLDFQQCSVISYEYSIFWILPFVFCLFIIIEISFTVICLSKHVLLIIIELLYDISDLYHVEI